MKKERLLSYIPYGVAGGLVALDFFLNQHGYNLPTNFQTKIVAGALYGISALADYFSTSAVFDAADRARSRGYNTQGIELQPFARNIHTGQQFRDNFYLRFVNIAILSVAIRYPDVGLILATGKSLAAFNNLRIAKSINRLS